MFPNQANRIKEDCIREFADLSDERVMLEVQQGNGDAFAVLFDRYHRLVLVTALKILRDVGEAEEGTNVTPRLPSQELNRLIEQALGSLKESERRTIRLVFFEGLTLKEVAERTEESFSNVRNHYYRGLDHLRACLAITPVALRTPRVLLGEVNRAKA